MYNYFVNSKVLTKSEFVIVLSHVISKIHRGSIMIEQRNKNGYTVTSISGKLMGGPETDEFNKYVDDLQNNGIVNLVFDLGGVRWINGAGIGALITCFNSFKNTKRSIKFANPSPKVKDILDITRLSAELEIYDSVESAIK